MAQGLRPCTWLMALNAWPLRHFTAATITKLIKDNMPADMRIGGDAVEMMLACCTGELMRNSK